MENDDEQLCRLCFESGNINIFDANGISLDIASAIKLHLQCEVEKDDKYSNAVRSDCWNQVKGFHTFYEFVKTAQNTHLHRWIKDEPSNTSEQFVEAEQISPHTNDINDEDNCFGGTFDIKLEAAQTLVKPDIQNVEPINSILELIEQKKHVDATITVDVGVDHEKDAERSQQSMDEESNYSFRERARPKISKYDGESTIISPFNSILDKQMHTITKSKPRGEIAKQRSTYTLSEEYENFMLDVFVMSCDLCLSKFATFFDAKTHYMAEHQIEGYIRCCSSKFIYISQVKDHIDNHLNPDVHKCKLCNKSLSSKVFLQRHLKQTHQDADRFVCDICGHSSNRRPHLFQHIFRKHVPPKHNLKCEQCGKLFPSEDLLHRHIQIVHTKAYNRKRVACEICGKSVNAYALERHKLTHMNTKQRIQNRVQCDICGEWLLSPSSLKNHKEIHSKTPAKCEQCTKVFNSKHNLMSHIRRTHRERHYKCSRCPRTFPTPAPLNKHMESHTRDKVYPCAFCPKVFQVVKSKYVHYSRMHRVEFEDEKRMKRLKTYGALKVGNT